jgi:SAM-dependent MidA family methyltransferase
VPDGHAGVRGLRAAHVHALNALAERLRERIAREGPIPFSAFMEAALYDPADGFYARGARIGPGGTFTTAPVALPLFARALAHELRLLHEALGRPAPFTLVEVGPGNGVLAARLREALEDIELRIVLCDRARGMLEQAAAGVPDGQLATLDELEPVTGAIVTNELHDACPCELVRWPKELRVAVGPDRRLRLEEGPDAGSAVVALLAAAGVEPEAGQELAVAPAQAELHGQLARLLERGRLFTFDYGEAGPQRYLRPVPRLRSYLAGQPGGDPLAQPGVQDLTCDVDFGAIRAAGEAAGLRTVLDESQAAWLRHHGALAETAAAPPGSEERLWLQALAGEGSAGESFRVLVQER